MILHHLSLTGRLRLDIIFTNYQCWKYHLNYGCYFLWIKKTRLSLVHRLCMNIFQGLKEHLKIVGSIKWGRKEFFSYWSLTSQLYLYCKFICHVLSCNFVLWLLHINSNQVLYMNLSFSSCFSFLHCLFRTQDHCRGTYPVCQETCRCDDPDCFLPECLCPHRPPTF